LPQKDPFITAARYQTASLSAPLYSFFRRWLQGRGAADPAAMSRMLLLTTMSTLAVATAAAAAAHRARAPPGAAPPPPPKGCHGGPCGGMADYPTGPGIEYYAEFDVPGKPKKADGICFYIYFNIFFSGKGDGRMNQVRDRICSIHSVCSMCVRA
jgi:hypothetical protein